MESNEQLQTYINKCLTDNVSEVAIVDNLRRTGWSDNAIQTGLQDPSALHIKQLALAGSKAKYPHKIRKGVLWILSPLLLFVFIIILQIVARSMSIHSVFVNILSLLGGMAAVILIPVGLVMGIITLDRK